MLVEPSRQNLDKGVKIDVTLVLEYLKGNKFKMERLGNNLNHNACVLLVDQMEYQKFLFTWYKLLLRYEFWWKVVNIGLTNMCMDSVISVIGLILFITNIIDIVQLNHLFLGVGFYHKRYRWN